MNLFTRSISYYCVIACFSCQYVFAQATLYVASDGNNNDPVNNNCSDPAFKCLTIQYALSKATAGDIILATGNLTSEPMPITITKSITLRGAQAGVKPVLNASFAPVNRGTETTLNFGDLTDYILVNDGVNDVTIEGFEINNTYDDDFSEPEAAIIRFGTGAAGNTNLTIRRNIQNGNGDQRSRFLFKGNTGGDLTNLRILENRILGLGNNYGVQSGVSTGYAAITIQKASLGEIRGNIISTSNLTQNRVQKGIELSNITNFTVAENEFRATEASAIEVLSANAGGTVVIESNTIIACNASAFINEAGTNSPIAGGIVLGANAINSSSFIIRNNDFQGNNRFAIAIPNAYNNFTTNNIQIIENKFSITNAVGNNGNADLYVGNDTDMPSGTINTNGNWWGHMAFLSGAPNAIPAALGNSPGGNINADILGGVARTRVLPVIWLISPTDANGASPGFVSSKTATCATSNLQAAFDAIPENWILRLQNTTYSGAYSITRNAFTLDPTDANQVFIRNLILNAPGKIITANKTFTITDFAGGGNLTLTSGKFQLGNNDIIVADQKVTGGNEDSYVITNGTGRLIQTDIGTSGFKSGEVNFPVGPNDDYYTPVTINNAGIADNFSVRVQEGISPAGNTGTIVTTNAVDLTWDISEETVGGSDAAISLQWSNDPAQSNEQPGFDANNSYVSHYTGTVWESFESPKPAVAGTVGNSAKQTVSGINSFSPFTVGDVNAPLPVDFVSFNASLLEKDVQLAWKTSSEINNAFFTVERSMDGITFSEIGLVTGNGTSNQSHQYYFTDAEAANAGSDVLYYRLKQVDTDETFAYSKVVSITINNFVIKLSPNPAHEQVIVRVPQWVKLDVVNSRGQIVRQQEIEQQAVINTTTLPQGMYIFRFFDGKTMHYRKVAVQK